MPLLESLLASSIKKVAYANKKYFEVDRIAKAPYLTIANDEKEYQLALFQDKKI